MARVITKEHAVKIAEKLEAKVLEEKGHSRAYIFYDGKVVASFGIRRGSEKDQGHDHIQKEIMLNGHNAKQLANCPLTAEQYFQILIDKGKIEVRELEPPPEKKKGSSGPKKKS